MRVLPVLQNVFTCAILCLAWLFTVTVLIVFLIINWSYMNKDKKDEDMLINNIFIKIVNKTFLSSDK